jgi:hypothetical protein
MYKVVCKELNEVKCETKDLSEAIQEAIEWAEYDDICMVVINRNGKEVFRVSGYEAASELMMMQEGAE